jgi:hypothetical protein
MMKSDEADVKGTLVGLLKELHLPAFRAGYEELALQAQQESSPWPSCRRASRRYRPPRESSPSV